jgi:GT2 family glycosyltransferase
LQFASYRLLVLTNFVSQPATFWRQELSGQCGLFDPGLQYVMDYDYWLRIWKLSPPYFYKRDLAAFRIQRHSKTASGGHLQAYIREESQVIARHSPGKLWRRLHAAHRFLMTSTYRVMNR